MRPDESERDSDLSRTLLLVVLVLALLAGPLWVEVLHLNDPTYRYERAEVVVDGGTIEYASETDAPTVAISTEVLCSEPRYTRACALERALLQGGSVPADIYHRGSNSPDIPNRLEMNDYEYVTTRDAIFRPIEVTNRSQAYVINDGGIRRVDNGTVEDPFYRVDVDLERAEPEAALEDIAIPIERVGPVTRGAVRHGAAESHRRVAIPETPVRLEDGTYYRIYLSEKRQPPPTVGTLVALLQFGAPLAGIVLGARLRDRFEIRYVGTD